MNTKRKQDFKLSQFELSKITLKNLNRFNLSPTAKLVLLSLVDCYNPVKAEIYPKQKTIADQLGISERSVIRAIKEIVTCQFVIYETKSSNRYKFTSTFFDLVNLSYPECQNDISSNDNMSSSYIEQRREQIKNKVVTFELTEFQKKYADVFEKLSERDYQNYRSLQGFEKENWLKNKRKEIFQAQESKKIIENIEKDKQNTGSPLDFNKEQALNYLNNLPAFLYNSFFGTELRKKYLNQEQE